MPSTIAPTETERLAEQIERLVGWLNEALGLDPTDYANRVSYGYIGNVNGFAPSAAAYRDDRYWYIFLPHPGRVGTERDRIGGHRTGDVEGMQRTLALAAGALQFARWNGGR